MKSMLLHSQLFRYRNKCITYSYFKCFENIPEILLYEMSQSTEMKKVVVNVISDLNLEHLYYKSWLVR